jgi:hypothetical protein
MGRNSSFRKEYCEQAEKLCLLGATDADLADFFGVSYVTINAWKQKYPKFLKSLKTGKDEADTRVERSLYHRAIGYEHPEVHVSNFQGAITLTPMIKRYPPDTVAAIFWLKNRKKAEWRDRQEVEHTVPAEIIEKLWGK